MIEGTGGDWRMMPLLYLGMTRRQLCGCLRGEQDSRYRSPEVGPRLRSFKLSKESTAAGWREQ